MSAPMHDAQTEKEVPELTTAAPAPVKRTRVEVMSSYFTIAAAAAGLISDGYQNNIMTLSNVVFKKLYPSYYVSDVSTRVSNSLLVGAILGQVIVGLMTDRLGRKFALIFTTMLIVIGALLGTVAHGAHGSVAGLFWFLTIARGITGLGVGGEYPASSTSASEAANENNYKTRGPVYIMVTNFVLSFGGPLASCVYLIVLSAAGEDHLPTVWRTCFGIGIVLPLTVLIFRLRMISSRLYRDSAIKNNVPYGLVIKYYWKTLIGTCGAWFLYDFVTFPNGVFSGVIISSVVDDTTVKTTAEWQLLLSTIALPGVFVGAWLANRIGRPYTMMVGFGGYLVIGLIIGLAYDKITKITPLFIVFYGLMQSFGNLGPGDIIGLASAESYATAVRGTCYGLSAAIGKTGAAVGTQAFTPIQTNLGKKWTFIIAAICGISGIIVTYFFIPDMTNVDLAEEDKKFMKYLDAQGWRGEVGEVVEIVRDEESFASDEKVKE